MTRTLSLFLAVLWLSTSGSFSAEPELIFSSNVTSIQVGASAKLRCQVDNFAPGKEDYWIYFYTGKGIFCDYYINDLDSSGQRSTRFNNLTSLQPSLGRHPVSSSFPIYEITVTPTLSSTDEYYCNLWRVSPRINVNSARLSITVTPLPSPPTSPLPTSPLPTPVPSPPPRVLASSNGTSLEVGKTVKLRCQVMNFPQGKAEYGVTFYREDYGFVCSYTISAPDSSGQRTTSFANYTSSLVSLGRQPLSSTFPVYEITVTPTIAATSEYYCNLFQQSPRIDVYSNYLSITATPPPPPTSVLSSNVSAPPLAHPFMVTCTFDHFTAPPLKYSVQFLSSRDGQLAVFEVTNGNVLISDVINNKVDVFPGPKSTFPTFHLVLTEKVEVTSSYWCDLVEAGKAQIISQPWPTRDTSVSRDHLG